MTLGRYIRSGLVHFWRRHLGTGVGAAFSTAVLVGALAVGDSVDGTLARRLAERLGRIEFIATAGDRFFVDDLGDRISNRGQEVSAATVLQLEGVASTPAGTGRALNVSVLGIDESFYGMAPAVSGRTAVPPPGRVLINDPLARQLNVAAGDTIVLRVRGPDAVPAGSALGDPAVASIPLRVQVERVADQSDFASFNLRSDPTGPFNAFVDRQWLQQEVDLGARANLLLARSDESDLASLNDLLADVWTLDDAELEVRLLFGEQMVELRSRRIFIDRAIVEGLVQATDSSVRGFLTYFVNEIRNKAGATTPYSMVAAAKLPETADLSPEGIIVNDWLAEDLEAVAGDSITLRYFQIDEQQRLIEVERTFTVEGIVPMTGWAADETLMPDFPGIAEAERSREWESDFPLDLGRLRDKDETYWENHRGTPKAFVSWDAGRAMWSNRFGSATSLRTEVENETMFRESVRKLAEPLDLGLGFRSVRDQAARGAATDFGGLFLGLSFFLIAAAVMLCGMFFVFAAEQRSREFGLLLALGFTRRRASGIFLTEGFVVAAVGGVVGIGVGLAYTNAVLLGLETVWRDAVGGSSIEFAVTPMSVLIGIVVAVLCSAVAMALALRSLSKRPAIDLLRHNPPVVFAAVKTRPWSLLIAMVSIVAGGSWIMISMQGGSADAAAAFFGGGALILIGAVSLARALILRTQRTTTSPTRQLGAMGIRNLGRRPGRSVVTTAILACGVFLVAAVGVNRLAAVDDRGDQSGTGGFELFGRSTVGVFRSLESDEGRTAFGLSDSELEGVSIVPMRVRAGDEASCLNLTTPTEPRLVGVDAKLLAGRFSFADALKGGDGWALLDRLADGAVPAVGDAASVRWTMHKKLGDTIRYTDERGREFDVRIVALVSNSTLQGSLFVDQAFFEERFPSIAGSSMFLVDVADSREPDEVAARLTQALSDVGLELTPSRQRLAAFNSVQNTYLSIFEVLGALGLLLGSIGLGVVVLRNVLERSRELAILRAIGFTWRRIRGMVMIEHVALVVLGVSAGVIPAFAAALPALRSRDVDSPIVTVITVGLMIGAAGIACVLVATLLGTRGALMDRLRSE